MDFLTFESFVSIPLLITAYYLGVIILPLLLFAKRRELLQYSRIAEAYTGLGRVKLFGIMAFFFIVVQIFWRMMFETLIGYFQMREYLQQLAG